MAEKLSGNPGPKSNVTDETRREAYREALTARRELDKASGVYRAVIKRFKGMGIDTTALTNALKRRSDDPDELRVQLAEEIRMLEISNFPNLRTNLFGDPIQEDDQERHDMDLLRVKDAGHFSGVGSERRDSNPESPGTDRHVMWDEGWIEGKAALDARAADMHEPEAPAGVTRVEPRKRGRPAGGKNKLKEGLRDQTEEARAELAESRAAAAADLTADVAAEAATVF